MRNILLIVGLILSCVGLASCDKTDEVPPVTDKTPSGYRMPDPQVLSDSDRAVIDSMQAEYDQNAN